MAEEKMRSKPSWLQKLEAESWEAELLVSGAAVYGTLQLPGLIRKGMDWAVVSLAEEYLFFAYYIFWFLIICSSALIFNFIIHFILRAFWIGMIGLVSVFPDGINPESETYSSHFLRQLITRFPDPTAFNQKLDRLCSQIFAISFAFAMGFFAFDAITLLFLLIAAVLNMLSPAINAEAVLVILFALLILPGLFSAVLNSKSMREKEWVKRIHFPFFVGVYSRILYHVFYEPLSYISYIFTTNIRLKSVGFFMVLYMLGLMFLSIPVLLNSNGIYLLKAPFYSMGRSQDLVNPRNYEIYRKEGQAVIRPLIQSEVIEGPFLKLYIPVFEREESTIRGRCGDFDAPVGLTRFEKRQLQNKHRLACLADSYYRIEIDGAPVDTVKFFRFEYTDSPGEGVLTYLSTAGLASGEHQLHIIYPLQDDQGRPKQFYIPFWISDKE